ncbi:hypothetical protein AB0L26_10250 [Streptomyces nondiastaticus]|uniref:hypothetical protein n=1 Tax=Streptomyces nondiastaticus TaxID=3154512 RepID=UPI003432698E
MNGRIDTLGIDENGASATTAWSNTGCPPPVNSSPFYRSFRPGRTPSGLVSPELADVLSAIICRVRDTTGAVPLVRSYDRGECEWQEPAPLLFQRRICGEDRAFTDETVRTMLDQALIDTGLTDATGEPLRYTPHDFRRLFSPMPSSTDCRRISPR